MLCQQPERRLADARQSLKVPSSDNRHYGIPELATHHHRCIATIAALRTKGDDFAQQYWSGYHRSNLVWTLAGRSTAAPTKPAAAPAATSAPAAATKPAAAATTAPAAAATKPAAAAPTAAPVAKIKRGGTLKYAKSTEWAPNMDPHQNTGWPAGYDMIFSTFTKSKLDPATKSWSLVPGVAESWEQPDAKTIVLKLRKDVTFHDGSKFNAEVARWNLDRMKSHPKSAAKTEAGVIDSMQVVDDYTLKLNLKNPPAGLLGQLSDSSFTPRMWITSKEAAEKNGDASVERTPVGSGPMTFVEWMPGDHMTVKKWDKYWENGDDGQPLPYMDGVLYRVVKDPTVRAVEIRTGNVDATDEITAKDLGSLKTEAGLSDERIQLVRHPPLHSLQYKEGPV